MLFCKLRACRGLAASCGDWSDWQRHQTRNTGAVQDSLLRMRRSCGAIVGAWMKMLVTCCGCLRLDTQNTYTHTPGVMLCRSLSFSKDGAHEHLLLCSLCELRPRTADRGPWISQCLALWDQGNQRKCSQCSSGETSCLMLFGRFKDHMSQKQPRDGGKLQGKTLCEAGERYVFRKH